MKHFPHDRNIVTIDKLSFANNCTTFANPISLSVPHIQPVYSPPQSYYVATHLIQSISKENKPLLSCSPSMDLVLAIDLVAPSMGALEPSFPPIDPSECSFYKVVLPSYEDLLEAMTRLSIPSDDASMVLSNDHIFGLDYSTTEPNPNFRFEPNLAIGRSLDMAFTNLLTLPLS